MTRHELDELDPRGAFPTDDRERFQADSLAESQGFHDPWETDWPEDEPDDFDWYTAYNDPDEEDPEPECTCVWIDVDQVSAAGCPLHGPTNEGEN